MSLSIFSLFLFLCLSIEMPTLAMRACKTECTNYCNFFTQDGRDCIWANCTSASLFCGVGCCLSSLPAAAAPSAIFWSIAGIGYCIAATPACAACTRYLPDYNRRRQVRNDARRIALLQAVARSSTEMAQAPQSPSQQSMVERKEREEEAQGILRPEQRTLGGGPRVTSRNKILACLQRYC